MLVRSLGPALLAMAGLVHATSFSDLASCGQSCINNMDTTIGCVPVTPECLCSNANFVYGIRDCANSACSSSADASAAVSYASSSCASVLAAPTAAETTTEATSASETPATTTEASTNSVPQETTMSTTTSSSLVEAAQTSASDTSAATTATTSSGASTTAAASTETSASSGTAATSGSHTTGGSSAVSSTASASGASSSSSSPAPEAPGLSAGVKAGIVVGSASAAVAVVGLVMWASRKRSKPLPRGTMKISEPLPGSGRIGDDVWEQYHQPQYSPPPPRTAGSNMSELDRHARPYDEMIPRTTPTRMV